MDPTSRRTPGRRLLSAAPCGFFFFFFFSEALVGGRDRHSPGVLSIFFFPLFRPFRRFFFINFFFDYFRSICIIIFFFLVLWVPAPPAIIASLRFAAGALEKPVSCGALLLPSLDPPAVAAFRLTRAGDTRAAGGAALRGRGHRRSVPRDALLCRGTGVPHPFCCARILI